MIYTIVILFEYIRGKGGIAMQTENHLHIAVCDDRIYDLSEIISMTSQILQEENIDFTIIEYTSSVSLLADMQSGKRFGLLLLDVMMDDLDGMQLAAELRRQGNKIQIVFISCNREMAMDGYEVSAARYLAKPLNPLKLKEALLYCYRTQQVKKEILLPTDKGMLRTPLSDIQYVEAFDRSTKIVLKDKTLEIRLKFSDMEVMFPKNDFLRCHRAFLVNLRCVTFVHQYEFVLQSGLTVPIGQARYTEVKNKFADSVTE